MSASDTAIVAAAPRPERPDSVDTIYLANLPLDTTTASLTQWCTDNFDLQPAKIRVRKPVPRSGEPATHRYGHLTYDAPEVAASTLELLQSDDFTIGDARVEASWAKAPRAPRGGGDADGAKKRKPRKRTKKPAAGGEGGGAAAADADAVAAPAAGKKKRRPRRKKNSAAGAETADGADASPAPEPEPAVDEGRRVYAKNFGTEEELRTTLGAHGELEAVELKEMQRGPAAGTQFAFVVFAETAAAEAAVAALGTAEGTEPEEGALVVAMARPRKVRAKKAGGRARKPREPRSIRLEEPSTTDLCCRDLPYDMDDAGLRALFDAYDSVETARIITRGGRSRGYGFVHFGDAAQAAAAVDALAGQEVGTGVDGKQLLLRLDFAMSAPRPVDEEGEAAAADGGADAAAAADAATAE